MTFASDLHAAVNAVCPIVGVSLGSQDDRSTWRVDYADGATADQMAAAQQVLQSWTPAAITVDQAGALSRTASMSPVGGLTVQQLANLLVQKGLLTTIDLSAIPG